MRYSRRVLWMLREALIPAGTGLAMAIGAVAVGELRPAQYEAVTRVGVNPVRPADLGQTQAIREVMNSYVQDIPTLDMAVAAAQGMAADRRCASYDRDPGRLLGRLRVGSDLNVYEIQIKARSNIAAEAVCVSEKWTMAFVDRRQQANLQLDPLDRILTQPRDQTVLHRVWPRRRLVSLVGGLFGVVGGTALLLVRLYWRSGYVRRAADVERLGFRLLAVVPAQLRARRRPWRSAGRQRILSASRRWVHQLGPLLLFMALGAATAYLLSIAQPVVWRARTRIAVEPARGSDWGQTQAIREIMKGYSEDIKTRRMAERVNELVQADEPADQLLQRLNVAPKEGVYEIVVDVRHTDREMAIQLSRIWATTFVEERTRANLTLDQRDRILTRLRDQTTASRWTPNPGPNTAAGLAIGLIVGLAATSSLHYLARDAIQSQSEASKLLAVPVLAAIPSSADSHNRGRPLRASPLEVAS